MYSEKKGERKRESDKKERDFFLTFYLRIKNL